jgi:EAL domain-containing protein (putative c-di-GMP-specific phosphodiesterase class I)
VPYSTLDRILVDPTSIAIHFQPIVSLRTKAVIGAEALLRHQAPAPERLNPLQIFEQAAAADRVLELDRLCRRRAMADFAQLAWTHSAPPLLFVNFESSVIDQGVEGSGAIIAALRAANLRPQDVVIEINESKVRDLASLRRFVERHRAEGFIIALDDLGAGASNLPRIADLRPQILKLDRDLVREIDGDFIKQEMVKSLVSLGRRIGAMILAEGVETQAEVDTCAALGAELFQGYYFGRPSPPEALDTPVLDGVMQAAALRQRTQAVMAIQARRFDAQRLRRVSEAGTHILASADPTGYATVLQRLVSGNLAVECAYLLDRHGIQLTETITRQGHGKEASRLFSPAPKGTDHSNKEYFYSLLDAGLERYTTEPYLSLATGNLCRTVACLVQRGDGSKVVLCLDLHMEE